MPEAASGEETPAIGRPVPLTSVVATKVICVSVELTTSEPRSVPSLLPISETLAGKLPDDAAA